MQELANLPVPHRNSSTPGIAGNPLSSRLGRLLAITVLLVVGFGMLLPFTPLAAPLGFTPLPGLYFLFLAGMIVMYLLLVKVVKRWLMRRSSVSRG